MTFVMLLISATIVFGYNEYISQKIEKNKTPAVQLKWVNDGSNKVLMFKEGQHWNVVPTELINYKRYYPLTTKQGT